MGGVLPKPILSKVVERAGNSNVNASCASLNGFRISMEDAHMMIVDEKGEESSLFGVFDGHSGENCSNYIAAQMPAKLKALPEPVTAESIEKMCISLDETFLAQNLEGGSTGTFCIVKPDYHVTVANVGDSRIIICRGNQIIFQTQDHKPQDPLERERILRCGGLVVSNRVDGDLAVSRAFGDSAFKVRGIKDYKNQKVIAVPDVNTVECTSGDVIILACDGVFEGNFTNAEVCRFVHEQMQRCWDDVAVVACRVCDEAIRRGSKDNISCMIVKLEEGKSKVSTFGSHSYIPGPPYPRNHESCRTAYAKMAEKAHKSVAESLQLRYQLLLAYDRKQLLSQPPVMRTAFEMSDDLDIEMEHSFFGRGPAPGNERAFFESLAAGTSNQGEKQQTNKFS